ncbi:hypothetical protein GM418_17500 [Maribellus comscasis]|uniref:HTH luxR-type domain-containing protein n=1 Tax=Maribellus comscasis TaxID=2681766 RepID=A0A6I6K908_9BACT|nr:hypothetical protein GM418_17500 [Maribellus comscasis]
MTTSIVVASDFYKCDYYFVFGNFDSVFAFQKNRLPVTSNEWFRRRFHPDDYIINEGSIRALKYFCRQPVEKHKNLRLIHKFRIKNDNNKWIRLIVQKLTRLAPREKQVLELISEGHKSAQIAEKLFISINTVNNHRRNDREIKCFKYA